MLAVQRRGAWLVRFAFQRRGGRVSGAIRFSRPSEQKTGDDEYQNSLFFRCKHQPRHICIVSTCA